VSSNDDFKRLLEPKIGINSSAGRYTTADASGIFATIASENL
jgi:hypothetical protein